MEKSHPAWGSHGSRIPGADVIVLASGKYPTPWPLQRAGGINGIPMGEEAPYQRAPCFLGPGTLSAASLGPSLPPAPPFSAVSLFISFLSPAHFHFALTTFFFFLFSSSLQNVGGMKAADN